MSYAYATVYAPHIQITANDIDYINEKVTGLNGGNEDFIKLVQALQRKP